ncbi:hypothetical protein Pcinc_019823 [Petrolisthes cinctipes]|uniref:Adenosine deaminase n=1 Tax=Petrolisthes cinctipes TaxID=88211 RepID=A0AAE1KKL5_PETCI|nr:hypothetical protein Pcinc_019823 [Petrolisthes cinctipes]
MNISEYKEQRESFLAQEKTVILGQDQVLTTDEEVVNQILLTAKMAEMNDGFDTPHNFLPAKNFLTVISDIQASEVFKIIQKMPKGAALHVHDVALTSLEWVIEELAYWPDLYMCITPQDLLLLKFFDNPDTSCAWQLVSEVRDSYPHPRSSTLSSTTGFPSSQTPDDIRIDGTLLTPDETLTVYQDTITRFVQDHPEDFLGARYIYAPMRRIDNATMNGYVDNMIDMAGKFPNLVAGFDLVGQEDKGETLINLLEPLLRLSDADIPVFYHAGETDWMGMSTDENIVDALFLNATRIGHGYALVKHPKAKELALQHNTPIEVCPVSNQVLKLVSDLRNHPAAQLVAEGFPIVISSDDPGAWGSKGLSYDFYEAFMALGGAKADLRFLKQLAINSITYSSVDENTKSQMMQRWEEKWNTFISETLSLHTNTVIHQPVNKESVGLHHQHLWSSYSNNSIISFPPSTTAKSTQRP